MWPFRTKQQDHICFYKRNRRHKLPFQRGQKQARPRQYYDGQNQKIPKNVTCCLFEISNSIKIKTK